MKALAGQATGVGTCVGHCGGSSTDCYCDQVSVNYGDNCNDFEEACPEDYANAVEYDEQQQQGGGGVGYGGGGGGYSPGAALTLQQCHDAFPDQCEAPPQPSCVEELNGECVAAEYHCLDQNDLNPNAMCESGFCCLGDVMQSCEDQGGECVLGGIECGDMNGEMIEGICPQGNPICCLEIEQCIPGETRLRCSSVTFNNLGGPACQLGEPSVPVRE